MATFTPPSHNEYFAPPGADRLWSRVPYPRAHTVLINPLWTVTTYPGLQVVDGDTFLDAEENGYGYLGSGIYEIGADELTALVAAGYGAYITVPSEEITGVAGGEGVHIG